MDKLAAMIKLDPTVAYMNVDADGCDCIGPAVNVYINRGNVLVSRQADAGRQYLKDHG